MQDDVIIFVSDTPLDVKNAGGTHVLELFNNLSKYSETYLIVPKLKGNCKKEQRIACIPIINLPIVKYILYQVSLFAYLTFRVFCLSYKLKRHIMIYNRLSGTSVAPLFVSKIFRIPYIVEVNGLIIDELKLYKKSKYVKILKLIEKINYCSSSKIITVTEKLKKEIQKLYNIDPSKMMVVENGANVELFRPMDKIECKKKIKLELKTNYVCFVGNLAPWQGVEYLIQAAPMVLKEIPNTKFLIVGEGIMKEKLLTLVCNLNLLDKFIFTGAVPYENVPLYINASDVCVVYKKPLKSGYSPLKLYEYMACSKPVIASRVEGFEMLEQKKSGILVEPENPEELAKAIVKLMKDGKLRKKMGERGRKYVVKYHSWKNVAKKVVKICEKTVGEHKKRRC